MKFEYGGDTGKMHEAKVMGTPKVDPAFLDAFTAMRLRTEERGKRVDIDQVLALYTKYNKDDPNDPPGEHLGEIRRYVVDALGDDTETMVKAYSTSGVQPIDLRRGVDGFIEYTDPKTGLTARVTLDATLNRKKEADLDYKADFLVTELPDAVQENDKYLDAIDALSSKIASMIIKRTTPEQTRKAA